MKSQLTNDDAASTFKFIGDIHARYDKLEDILEEEGYCIDEINSDELRNHCKFIFLGDLIDNDNSQPSNCDHLSTLKHVKLITDKGLGYCILGNHELNAIGWFLKNKNNEPYRTHNNKNLKQHALFLAQVGENSVVHETWINWFKTLPLFLDFGDIRAIHACWNDDKIKQLLPYLNNNGSLQEKYWANAFDEEDELFHLLEWLLKGPELLLPDGAKFLDKTGTEREHIRVKWWLDTAKTYRDIAQVQPEMINRIPNTPLIEKDKIQEISIPVIIGHYTLHGQPQKLSDTVACIDYNTAKDDNPIIIFNFDRYNKGNNFNQESFEYENRETIESVNDYLASMFDEKIDSLASKTDISDELIDDINDILFKEWDPIGVNKIDECWDEYSSMAYGASVLAANNATLSDISTYLYTQAIHYLYMTNNNDKQELICNNVARLIQLEVSRC
jgi:hypothetical protein